MSSDIPEQYAYLRETPGGPVQVAPGDTITSFREEEWTFVRVSRKAYGNSSGRIHARRLCPDFRRELGECPHFWHSDDQEQADFFPHVFGLYLGDHRGNEI